MDQITKRGSAQQESKEASNAVLTSLEMKFKKQFQEQVDEKQRVVFEYENSISKLTAKERQLNLDLQLAKREHVSSTEQLTKKLEEAIEREQSLR